MRKTDRDWRTYNEQLVMHDVKLNVMDTLSQARGAVSFFATVKR